MYSSQSSCSGDKYITRDEQSVPLYLKEEMGYFNISTNRIIHLFNTILFLAISAEIKFILVYIFNTNQYKHIFDEINVHSKSERIYL